MTTTSTAPSLAPPLSIRARGRLTHARDLGVPKVDLPRVVVVGGGFAGLELVRRLDGRRFQVVLIDRKNFHTFQPLLYQVATAGLEPTSIVAPFRMLFRKKRNFHFRMADFTGLDPSKNCLHTSSGSIDYDYAVLCHGCTTNFFGNKALEELALPMKTIPEALDIRSLLLENLEEALVAKTKEKQQGLVDVVIVGGGPTGVELAGAFAELKRHVLPRDYPDLSLDEMDIHLVESGSRVLAGMSEHSSQRAREMLEALGVQVHLDTRVESYDGSDALLSGGKRMSAGILIWSAGIRANTTTGLVDSAFVGPQRRLRVGTTLEVDGVQNVFALGDCAAVIADDTPRGHPQMAPVAMQQATCLARNLHRRLDGQEPLPFRFKSQGIMATVGRNHAVVEVARLKFAGMFAWFVWMFVHLMAIVGFRNRFLIFLHWTLNYLTYDRSFRLVFRNVRKSFGGRY